MKHCLKRKHLIALAGLLILTATTMPCHAQSIWIEGEAAALSNFNQPRWYGRDKVLKHLLSPHDESGTPGQWLTHFSDKPADASARYIFDAEQAGSYVLWLRVNPGAPHVPCVYQYAIDGGEAKPVELTDARGWLNLSHPTFDLRFLAWYKIAAIDLTDGRHTLDIILPARDKTHGGIDAICFANPAWQPSGTLRPEQVPADYKPGDWFYFLPGDDAFSKDSIIDMSHLIEKPAGKRGFVNHQDDKLVFEDGTAVKFWGLNAHMAQSPDKRDQQARFYTKHGVNLVREHPVQGLLGLLKRDPETGIRYYDPEKLDKFDKWFATLKDQGIYMCWSLFYPLIIDETEGYPAKLYAELPKKHFGRSTSGLVNFMPQLQDAQWQAAKVILEHVNPYTGLAYKDDPALAIVEVHNEDCIFWHAPLNDLADGKKYPNHTAILKKQWGQWVRNQYRTNTRLRKAWGKGFRKGDSVSNPDMKIYAAWEMTATGPKLNRNEKSRMGDFIRFLTETQRQFYLKREKQLRDLGFKGITVTTAWRAGGPAAEPANIYCDDAMDMIDRHNYFGGGEGHHNIATGKVYNNTHLDKPGGGILASGLYQVEDKPFAISEWTMCAPSEFKAEMAPLFTFYGMGLQGWDASMHFAAWSPRLVEGWPNMRAYASETPHYFGQFPALTFALYNGHIKQGDLIAARRLAAGDLFQGVDALSQDFTGGGYDRKELTGNLATPPETLAIGRVTVKIADNPKPALKADWSKYWDKNRQAITSTTGELHWHYGRRIVLVTAEKTQAVIGFAGAGQTHKLPALTAKVKTPFVSLIFTALDNQPLVQSKHILITAMARDKQLGARYNEDGDELLHAGQPPLLMEPVQAEISFAGDPITSVRPVDIYGVPINHAIEHNDNQFQIDGRYGVYYYEVKR